MYLQLKLQWIKLDLDDDLVTIDFKYISAAAMWLDFSFVGNIEKWKSEFP